MPRTIYTERDIEDMAKRGVTEIEVNDSVYITDVALELMDKLGMKRKFAGSASPSPTTSAGASTRSSAPSSGSSTLTEAERQQVIDKVKSGVLARLGAGVDAAVVDKIVRKVVAQL